MKSNVINQKSARMSSEKQQGKSSRLIRSAFSLTAFVLLVKILGLVKQIVLASAGGISMEMDVFYLAGNTMNHISDLVFSAISISALSIYTERLTNEGSREANRLISTILKTLIPAAAVLSLIFILFSGPAASFFAPGFKSDELNILAKYFRILAPMLIMVVYSKTLNVVLENHNVFIPGKFRPFLQNLIVIAAALVFYPKYGTISLIYGFLAASVIQASQITLFALKHYHFNLAVKNNWSDLKLMLMLSLPLFCGNAIYEINDIVDKQIATGLGEGTVSIMTYGASINEIVTSLIVSSVSIVLFSQFTKWVARGEKGKITGNLEKSIPALFFLICPILVFCILCPDLLISVMYGRGKFNAEMVSAVSSVVTAYAFGFLFQACQAIFVKVFYAFQKSSIPMVAGIIAVSVNIPLSLILSKLIGPSGIAYATDAAAAIAVVFLIVRLRKVLPEYSLKTSSSDLMKIIFSGFISGLVMYTALSWFSFQGFTGLMASGLIILSVHLICCFILRVNILNLWVSRVRKEKN